MSVTILEALQNARINFKMVRSAPQYFKKLGPLKFHFDVGFVQLNNAMEALESGLQLSDEIEEDEELRIVSKFWPSESE